MKRLLNKVSFILILCILPFLALGLKSLLNDTNISIRIGLYNEDSGESASLVIERLNANIKGISFTEFSSKDDMLQSIRSKRYDCGFIFPENFSDNVTARKTKNLINLYISPGTTMGSIASEYVFAEVYTLYAFEELVHFIDSRNYFSFDSDELSAINAKLSPIYQKYLYGDETFSFEYITQNNSIDGISDMLPEYILGSTTGIAALFIMLGAFSGTVYLYKDTRKGIFYAFPAKLRTLCKLADIFSGAALTAVSALLTIIVCNELNQLPITLCRLFLYVIICTLYCYLLYRLLPSIRIFSAVMPILIIGSIIFCSIFVDFSVVLPVVKYLKWLFPPTYFFIL